MQPTVKSRVMPRLIAILIAVMIIAPALLSLAFIASYGVNCVYMDQWEIVPLFDKLYSGTLSFNDLIAQQNEHRSLLPRLAMLGLGSLTHYNTVAEMYLSWALLCLICLILFKMFTRSFGFSKMSMAKFIPVTWLVFSLRQYENLLWGFELVHFMVALFFLLAVYLLAQSRRLDWRFGLAVLCGVASTFSQVYGLLVWPVGLIQLLCSGRPASKQERDVYIGRAVAWALSGVAVYILYFVNFVQPPQTPNMLYSLQQPVMAAKFGLVAMGNPISLDILTATSVGMLLLLLYMLVAGAAVFSPRMLPVKFPYLSLVLFSLAAVATLTVGRAGWGVPAAFEPRYATMTGLGIIGLYILVISLDIKSLILKYALSFLLIALVTAGIGPTAVPVYWEMGKKLHSQRLNMVSYLSTYNYQDDENLRELYPWPGVLRERAGILIKYGQNVFNEESLPSALPRTLDAAPVFHIDSINDKSIGPQNLLDAKAGLDGTFNLESSQGLLYINAREEKIINITGWAIDAKNSLAAGIVLIDIDGNVVVSAKCGLDRPDVAAFLKNDNYRFSGFEAPITTSDIGYGKHVVTIKIISADEQEYYKPVRLVTLDIQ